MKLKLNNYSHEFDYKFKDTWYCNCLIKPGNFKININDLNQIVIYRR